MNVRAATCTVNTDTVTLRLSATGRKKARSPLFHATCRSVSSATFRYLPRRTVRFLKVLLLRRRYGRGRSRSSRSGGKRGEPRTMALAPREALRAWSRLRPRGPMRGGDRLPAQAGLGVPAAPGRPLARLRRRRFPVSCSRRL